jgi:hypothetical protein
MNLLPMKFPLLPLLLIFAFAPPIVSGNICDNYGLVAGPSCSCPPGFGGPTCSQPACGGNLFQGSVRPLVSSNVSGCTCEGGWVGLGCNGPCFLIMNIVYFPLKLL